MKKKAPKARKAANYPFTNKQREAGLASRKSSAMGKKKAC